MTDAANSAVTLYEHARRADGLRTRSARLDGVRQELEREAIELRGAIALAKGRLGMRGDVGEFLDGLQMRLHERTVGLFAEMLSAAMHDVIPDETSQPIDLKLETISGAPSLSIKKIRPDGRHSDIFEGEGGGLTNVICLALRVIAVVQDKRRKFLVLDEPDCWLEAMKIPAFFGLIKHLCSDLGIQILVITHHDQSSFSQDANIIDAVGSWVDGITVVQKPGARQFAEGEAGIREIRLRNYSSFANATFKLSPGLNVFTGANNIGKSRLTRGLRGVAYGGDESGEEDVRDLALDSEIDFLLENGRTLQWARRVKGNPITLWRMCDSNGEVVDLAGTRCDSGGKTVPEWVGSREALGIAKIQGLDPHIGHQKVPIFLLKEPGSCRAKVLSIGSESDFLRVMIAEQKLRCTADTGTIRVGEPRLSLVNARLSALTGLARANAMLDEADATRALIEAAIGNSDLAGKLANRIAVAKFAYTLRRSQMEALQSLPLVSPNVAADMAYSIAAGKAAARIASLVTEQGRAKANLAAISGLPSTIPEMTVTGKATALAARIEQLGARLQQRRLEVAVVRDLTYSVPIMPVMGLATSTAVALERAAGACARARTELATVRASAAEAERTLAAVLQETGDRCPVCGTHGITHSHILNGEAA